MARCARHARDLGAARLAWEEILATCWATGSTEGEVEAHNQLAEFSQLLGDHTAAVSSLRRLQNSGRERARLSKLHANGLRWRAI